MRNILLVMILACSWAQANVYGIDVDEVRLEYTNAKHWACKFSEYDCTDMVWPGLRIDPAVLPARGTVHNGSVVISPYLVPGTDRESTLVHELVHWLQYKINGDPHRVLRIDKDGVKKMCGNEAEAFMVTDKYLRFVARGDLVRGANWWEGYPHCYEFYHPRGLTFEQVMIELLFDELMKELEDLFGEDVETDTSQL